MHLAGIPLRDELVLELARLVDDDDLSSRLETAYGRMTKVLALTIPERETIIRALDDAPPGLEELRAVLLREHVGRVRDGLVYSSGSRRHGQSPSGATARSEPRRSDVDKLDEGLVAICRLRRSVQGMSVERTFAVTPIRPGPVPYFEVGAFRYTGSSLPDVGDFITITKATTHDFGEREELLAYVTRVVPASDTPIRVTEATAVTSTEPDDLIVVAV